jgi:hypothetical protein
VRLMHMQILHLQALHADRVSNLAGSD